MVSEPLGRFYSGPPSPLGRVNQVARQWSRGLGRDRVFGSWALVLVLQGSGRYRDALGNKAELAPGAVILVFPDLAHHYGPPPGAEPWEEIYLVFDGPVFDLWRAQGLVNTARPFIRVDDLAYWQKRFESFLAKPSAGPIGVLKDVLRVQELLADLHHVEPGPGGGDAISRAMARLDRDPGLEIDWRSFASRHGLGYESFRKQFRQRAGVPPVRYRLQRLIERSCALLQTGELNHREVADRLGFSDEFHFSRSFRKVMGMSPKTYRERMPRKA